MTFFLKNDYFSLKMTIFLSKIIILLSIMTILLTNMIIFVYKLPLYLLKHFQIHNICFVFDIKNKHTFSMKFFWGASGGGLVEPPLRVT